MKLNPRSLQMIDFIDHIVNIIPMGPNMHITRINEQLFIVWSRKKVYVWTKGSPYMTYSKLPIGPIWAPWSFEG